MKVEHVYIHVPFCARRCAYCDFSIAVRRVVPVDDFLQGISLELAQRFPAATPQPVRSIYLGGGTPSRLGGEGIARLLDLLRTRWQPAADAEITLEANPEDVTTNEVRAWAGAGVNRISLGAQSFDAAVLAWMHRVHDASAIGRAAESIREGGINSWSLDLIYALPPEVSRDWPRDLELAIALGPDHLSAYGLTVERGTALDRWRQRGLAHDADETTYEREFLQADERLAAGGYEHYEVSNFARSGRRALHNSSYWRRVPYVGLGPSAHEFDGASRRWNRREYVAWLRALTGGRDPVEGSEVLSQSQAEIERVYLGLRSDFGVEIDSRDVDLVNSWVAQGWAYTNADVVKLRPLGWLRLDALAAALTDRRSRY
jgi:oxygen-independent coproporphyrinogen III oxidase